MAPVIRCALVIAGLAYYSPCRDANAIPDSVLDLGQPAAEALGVPLSRPEIELLRRMPGVTSGVADTLRSVSERLPRDLPRTAAQRSADPPPERSDPAHGSGGRTSTPR